MSGLKPSVEVLCFGNETPIGELTLYTAAVGAAAIGMQIVWSERYQGIATWLCLHGAAQKRRRKYRFEHVKRGRHVACWDHGYTERGTFMRVSVNDVHPNALLTATPSEPSRWNALGITLRDDYDPTGPIIIAGTGGRARAERGRFKWERLMVAGLRHQLPKHRIIYRPKPGLQYTAAGLLDCDIDVDRPIAETLQGASLLVCEHSSAAVDACIAGIPVRCTGGAAHWLYQRKAKQTFKRRFDFLCRLAWWQWRLSEMDEAWRFLRFVTKT